MPELVIFYLKVINETAMTTYYHGSMKECYKKRQ